MASPGIPRPKFNVGKIQVQGEFSGIWIDHASVKGQTADNLGLREIATAYEAGMEETFKDWHKGGRKVGERDTKSKRFVTLPLGSKRMTTSFRWQQQTQRRLIFVYVAVTAVAQNGTNARDISQFTGS